MFGVVVNWYVPDLNSDFRALHECSKTSQADIKVLHMLFAFLPDQYEIAC